MPTPIALPFHRRASPRSLSGWLLALVALVALLAPCAARARARPPSAAKPADQTRLEERSAGAAEGGARDRDRADDEEERDGAEARQRAREEARVRRACAEQAQGDQLLAGALRALGGGARIEAVRFTGLGALTEPQLWALLGGRPSFPIDADAAAGLLARLQASGLFAEVGVGAAAAGAAAEPAPLLREAGSEPALTASAAAARAAAAPPPPPNPPAASAPPAGPALSGGTLFLRLVEHARVLRASVAGLRESTPDELLSRMFEAPSPWELERSREPDAPRRTWRQRSRSRDDEPRARCPTPLPDREWLARVDDGFKPGLVWKGLPAAVERAVRWLRDEGYPLASLRAALAPDGALAIEVDEGRIQSLEVRGLSPRLTEEVQRALSFAPGAVFSGGELRRRLAALRERFPYLERDGRRRTRSSGVEARQEAAPEGGLVLTVGPPAPAASEPEPERRRTRLGRWLDWGSRWDDDSWDDWDLDLDWDLDWDEGRLSSERVHRSRRSLSQAPFEVTGPGKVAVYLHARRADVDVDGVQLIRHTPATGFAPGLAATLRLWDPGDRVHVAFDGLFAINTKRHSREAAPGSDLLQRLAAQEKVDWLIGVRAQVPALRIAELGGQLYTLTDTNDAWRLGDLDSYLWSALIARADREYFRRAGASALLTLHLFDQLTLGAEYRRDRWEPLANPRVWSLFNADDPPPMTAPVDAATLGSVVLRLEWATDDVPLHKVGARSRHPESSLVQRDDAPGPLFATVGTVEIGNSSLGSDAGVDFVKVVSDSRLLVDFGARRLLRLRLRAAGGRDLPLQKQEALGGWSALRGYDFKELRGDASLLASFEVRNRWLGGFLDVGAVHQPEGWLDPRLGAGAQFFFERHARLEAAWRLDGKASAAPSVRLLFGWEL